MMEKQTTDFRVHGEFFRAQRMLRWVGTYRALTQTEFWADSSGAVHLIDDMSLAYKQELLDFLEERIPVLQLDFMFGRVLSDPPGDMFTLDAQRWAEVAFDGEQLDLFHMHPREWFEDLPLVLRLRFDLLHGHGGSVEPDREGMERVMKRFVASLN